jgi:hypothetical protein
MRVVVVVVVVVVTSRPYRLNHDGLSSPFQWPLPPPPISYSFDHLNGFHPKSNTYNLISKFSFERKMKKKRRRVERLCCRHNTEINQKMVFHSDMAVDRGSIIVPAVRRRLLPSS